MKKTCLILGRNIQEGSCPIGGLTAFYSVRRLRQGDNITKILASVKADFVLVNLETGHFHPFEVRQKLEVYCPNVPIFLLTETDCADIAEKICGFKFCAVLKTPCTAKEIYQQIEKHIRLNADKKQQQEVLYTDLIGKSPAIKNLRQFIVKASESDMPVLLYGESGCGKDIAAELIHKLSGFKKGPYIAENVGCIQSELAESTLFGSVKGGFTGATNRKGLFCEAERGSLFLDELENLTLDVQAKLLRAVETKHIRAVGSDKIRSIDFRLICASNMDLKQMTVNKRFREDLLYRLDVLRFYIEPLRNRKEDIPLLADFHCKDKKISIPAYNKLKTYDWPGNIRELFNCLDRAVCNSAGSSIINSYHIEL